MVCRCSDIADCTQDIIDVNEVADTLSVDNARNPDITNCLISLAAALETSIKIPDMSTFTSSLKQMNVNSTDQLPLFIKSCEDHVSDLELDLSALNSEDEDYHNASSSDTSTQEG